MTLTYSGLAAKFPSGAITGTVIDFSKLSSTVSTTSIVPGLNLFLEGLASYINDVNNQQKIANSSATDLSFITKTEEQSINNPTGTLDPKLLTNTYTVKIDVDTSTVLNQAIDPTV